MIFVLSLLAGNTLAVKIIEIGPFTLPAGIVVFPVAYIFGDTLTEVYGYRKTRSVIWWGFVALAGMSLFYWLATILPPAPFWKDNEVFARLFGFVPRIAASSFVAYVVGELLNSIVLSKLKVKTKGRHFWLRAVASTVVGQGADSIIFNTLAFAGVFAWKELGVIILSGFFLKVAYEVVALPLTYAVVAWLKRSEGMDAYDEDISYNPLGVSV